MSREYRRCSLLRTSLVVNKGVPLNAGTRQTKLIRTYQPTYQLNARKRFDPERTQKVLKRIVDSELADVEYSETLIPELCLNLAEIIRNAVKEHNYDRCRIIVCVTIGQCRQQGIFVFHTFLWDHQRDSFASYNYSNPQIFANVVVYAVYLD